jgi:hypothetical protein
MLLITGVVLGVYFGTLAPRDKQAETLGNTVNPNGLENGAVGNNNLKSEEKGTSWGIMIGSIVSVVVVGVVIAVVVWQFGYTATHVEVGKAEQVITEYNRLRNKMDLENGIYQCKSQQTPKNSIRLQLGYEKRVRYCVDPFTVLDLITNLHFMDDNHKEFFYIVREIEELPGSKNYSVNMDVYRNDDFRLMGDDDLDAILRLVRSYEKPLSDSNKLKMF